MKQSDFDKLDWQEPDIDTLRLAVEQGQLLLRQTIETADIHYRRSYDVIKAGLGVLIVCLGYICSRPPEASLIYFESWILLISLVIVLAKAYEAYRTYTISSIANLPSAILTREKVDFIKEHAKGELYRLCLFNTCVTIDGAIRDNLQANIDRANVLQSLENRLRISLYFIIAFPVLWVALVLFGFLLAP